VSGGGDFSWTLGAALVEAFRLLEPPDERPSAGVSPHPYRGGSGGLAVVASASSGNDGLLHGLWRSISEPKSWEALGWSLLVIAAVAVAVAAAWALGWSLLVTHRHQVLHALLGEGWEPGGLGSRLGGRGGSGLWGPRSRSRSGIGLSGFGPAMGGPANRLD
jgi:hypothetical protein